MDRLPAHRVVDCDMFHGDVLITFEDGRMGIYSAELLHATLPQAEEVIDEYQEGERVIPFKLPGS